MNTAINEIVLTKNRASARWIRPVKNGTLALAAFFAFAFSIWAAEPVALQSMEMIPRFKITGEVGTLFRIEYNDDLKHSGQWVTLQNLVLPSSPFLFIDTNAPSKTSRIYRVTSQSRPPQLIWINPGKFMMGSPLLTEDERSLDEGPQTSVTISKKLGIGKYEVTQAEYLSVMGVNPSAFQDDLNRPVEGVSWYDAVAYCTKLTEQERLAGRLQQGYTYRLPTEAEWEYAARAGTATRFSFGNDPGYVQLSSYGWVGLNSDENTHPVGTKLQNPWGLYDMYGNVWEWCLDWYGSYLGSNLTDPQGPPVGVERVIRGGSWKNPSRFCRSASRASGNPFLPNNYVGFRVVLAPVSPP